MAVERTSHGYGLLIAATFGSEYGRLLLRLSDKHHPFDLLELLSLLGGHVVFALTLAERNDRDLLLSGVRLNGGNEAFADRIH